MKHLYAIKDQLCEGRDLPRLRLVSPAAESRPNSAPAYYQGRPASLWINVMKPRRRRQGRDSVRQSSSRHLQKYGERPW